MLTGREITPKGLPHLNGLSHLPGVPHLHLTGPKLQAPKSAIKNEKSKDILQS